MNTDLRSLYYTLSEEIKNNHTKIIEQSILFNLKKVSYPAPDQNLRRYQRKSSSWCIIPYCDSRMVSYSLWQVISTLEITHEIFNYIVDNRLSPFKITSFEEDLKRQPSITRNLITDFVVRILEYNQFRPIYNQSFFDKTYMELDDFLFKDRYKYKLLVNLHGPIGDIETLQIGGINIKKADYETSKLFCIYYSDPEILDYAMLESDYYIEIEREVEKTNWLSHKMDEYKFIDYLLNCLILSGTGNIELGEVLYISKAWPLIKTHKVTFIHHSNRYNESNLFRYEFNQSIEPIIQANYLLLENINYEKLEERILTSIKRFKKSKATINIEDKIIELVLSIEYLINTSGYEVTYQLCIKMIKLYDELNQDAAIFKLLKEFFNLRADVVHGKKKVELIPKNVSLIKSVEIITQKIIIEYIILNQNHTFKEINDALDKSIYLNMSVKEILAGYNNPLEKE